MIVSTGRILAGLAALFALSLLTFTLAQSDDASAAKLAKVEATE